jgi:hypothetical protein
MMVVVKTTNYAADEFAGAPIANLPSSVPCMASISAQAGRAKAPAGKLLF